MNSHFYTGGSFSTLVDSRNKTTREWLHDIYHSPFKEELINIHGLEAYEEYKNYRGCKDAKGGIEAAKRWREML